MADLAVNHDDRITRIALDRPERRNALSLSLMEEMLAALRALPDATEVVVIEANGPVFSAGHDLSEMVGRDAAFYDELFAVCTDLMLAVHGIPQPVIAKVHGGATAAGCQLVAACDLAVASEDAWFATPGVKIGLFCSTPMVPLTRVIGRRRALHMLFTGQPVDAPHRARLGPGERRRPGRRARRRGRRAGRADPVLQPAGRRPREADVLRPDRRRRGSGVRARQAGDGRQCGRRRRAGGYRARSSRSAPPTGHEPVPPMAVWAR